ncbi:Uncharacterized protein FKW44_013600, partial [Caligus rogercresseyi]
KSGLTINVEKSEILSSVNQDLEKVFPCYKYVDSTVLLGVAISTSGQASAMKLNYMRIEDVFEKGSKMFVEWKLCRLEKLRLWDKVILPKAIHLLRYTPFNRDICSRADSSKSSFV